MWKEKSMPPTLVPVPAKDKQLAKKGMCNGGSLHFPTCIDG